MHDFSVGLEASPLKIAPRVSVVIVCYNNAPFIDQALASAVNQTLPPCNVILVDNGSTDGSVEIAARAAAADERITLLRLARNDGPGIARDRGLPLATGDYVMFLDGDDLLEPTAIATACSVAEARGADLVQFSYRRCSEQGIAARHGPAPIVARGRDETRREMLTSSPAVWTRLYRRDFLTRVNQPFRPGIYEDIAWSARHILEADTPVIIPDRLVRHRVYRHSTIKARHAAHTDFADAIGSLVDVMRRSLPAKWPESEIGELAVLRIRKFLPNVLLRTGVRGWLDITFRLNGVMRGLNETELSGVSALLSGRKALKSSLGRFLFWNGNGVSALMRSGMKLLHGAQDTKRLPGTRKDIGGRNGS